MQELPLVYLNKQKFVSSNEYIVAFFESNRQSVVFDFRLASIYTPFVQKSKNMTPEAFSRQVKFNECNLCNYPFVSYVTDHSRK